MLSLGKLIAEKHNLERSEQISAQRQSCRKIAFIHLKDIKLIVYHAMSNILPDGRNRQALGNIPAEIITSMDMYFHIIIYLLMRT